MTTDTLSFTAGGASYSLDLAVTPISGTTDDSVTAITLAGGSGTNIKVSYNNSSQQVSTLNTNPVGIDISFVVNGVDYEFFSKGLGYAMVSGPAGNLTAYSVSNVVFVCFVEGTRIRTERGEVAVEDLRVGDLAVTTGGGLRPIRFVGHRRIDLKSHPTPELAQPIRISAHAFAQDRPTRDLYVSPGHCLCVDVLGEVLIRAGSLVNGATIQQIDVDSVAYWHVELDGHDVLLAENLPAESYMDVGNRSFFVESGLVSLIETPDGMARADVVYCRPLHEGGVIVDALRAQLIARAQALGWTLKRDPFNDLHLLVDGTRIEPRRDGLKAHFDVPAGAWDVRLVSIATRPCDLPDDTRDARALGACLSRLWVGAEEIALDDPRLEQGFHGLESYDWGSLRWTGAQAQLPTSLFGGAAQRLSVEMMRAPLPFWSAPDAKREARAA